MVTIVTKAGHQLRVVVPKDRVNVSTFVNGQNWPIISALDYIPGSIGWEQNEVCYSARGRILRLADVETEEIIYISADDIDYMVESEGIMAEPKLIYSGVVYQAVVLESARIGVFGEEHTDEETIGIYTRKGYGIDAIERYKKQHLEEGNSLEALEFDVRDVELDKDLIYLQAS